MDGVEGKRELSELRFRIDGNEVFWGESKWS